MDNPNIIPIDGAEHYAFQAMAEKSATRQAIARNAGDELSQMGTLADATHLLLYGVASLVAKLSAAQTLAEVRAAAEPFAAISGAFLTKVDSGEVKLPFMAKDFAVVVADIEQRASAVATVLAPAPALVSNQEAAS